jgi:hypothetical protein
MLSGQQQPLLQQLNVANAQVYTTFIGCIKNTNYMYSPTDHQKYFA